MTELDGARRLRSTTTRAACAPATARVLARAITLIESAAAPTTARRAAAAARALLPRTRAARTGSASPACPASGKSHVHRGARHAPDRAGPPGRGAGRRPVVARVTRRLDPRRQDPDGAPGRSTPTPSSGRRPPRARSAASPARTRETMLLLRGGRLRRRPGRDRRRRPVRDGGRRHGRHRSWS